MPNETLRNAQVAKKDEFYTQLVDIEKELKYYKQHFQGKVVLCNCDDPYESNFFKYFALNFNTLGLKKLIATCYNGSPIAGDELPLLFEIEEKEPKKIAYKVEITEVSDYNGDGAINLTDVQYLIQNDKNVLSLLKENGDFRSKECIELLKEADIVVTNPPFSLFREYLAQLVEYGKQFLILGNKNSLTYKEVFKLVKENRLWIGHRNINQDMWFIVPENEEKIVDGIKVRHIMACWYTNLDYPQRHEDLVLYKQYKPEEYLHFDNYDAINVDKVTDIPMDYYGVMGVPITFMDKYNPDQFEIIGLGNSRDNFTPNKDYHNAKKVLKDGKVVNGNAINCVLTIKRETKPQGEIYYTSDNTPYLVAPYARILIRRKK